MPGNPLHAVSPARSTWIGAIAALIGVGLRVVGALRPLDQPLWREGDLVAMARSFAEFDANPFHPRVAWRGTTNGLVEGEFPLVPWLTGMIWRATGEQLIVLRLIPLFASLLTLLLFWRLSSKYLRGPRGILAVAFLAVSPLPVFLGSAVQSDGVMLLGIVLAMWGVLRWTEERQWKDSRCWPVVTAVGIALAGLMKAPALHIAAVVMIVIVMRRGWSGLFRPRTFFVGLIAVIAPVAWVIYAHTLYQKTGLSLGVSNEHHFAGVELFTNPRLISGIVNHELRYVWAIGLFPALYGVWIGRQQLIVRVAFVWLLCVAATILIAGRTTGDPWAFYYHVIAAPPAAMLVGFGVGSLFERIAEHAPMTRWRSGVSRVAITLATIGVLLPGLRSSVGFARPRPPSALFECAQSLPAKLPEGLLLASGGTRFDDAGSDVAYDASYMFEWLNRTGWTVAIEDQSITKVETFRAKGAVAYFAEKEVSKQSKGFDSALRARYKVLTECADTAVLFDLRSRSE
jgi:hypothetical protein